MSRKKFVGSNLVFKATSRDHCSGLWAPERICSLESSLDRNLNTAWGFANRQLSRLGGAHGYKSMGEAQLTRPRQGIGPKVRAMNHNSLIGQASTRA
jgi:hypothetical protein